MAAFFLAFLPSAIRSCALVYSANSAPESFQLKKGSAEMVMETYHRRLRQVRPLL